LERYKFEIASRGSVSGDIFGFNCRNYCSGEEQDVVINVGVDRVEWDRKKRFVDNDRL
jgi:hypothetical protein